MSISGWFHKPVEGEEGYEGVEIAAPKSSLQQLVSSYIPPMNVPLTGCSVRHNTEPVDNLSRIPSSTTSPPSPAHTRRDCLPLHTPQSRLSQRSHFSSSPHAIRRNFSTPSREFPLHKRRYGIGIAHHGRREVVTGR